MRPVRGIVDGNVFSLIVLLKDEGVTRYTALVAGKTLFVEQM